MLMKVDEHKKAFNRTKESRATVVNFKDCRPHKNQKPFNSSAVNEGDTGFVKHVGQVKYINKSNLTVEVTGKRQETQIRGTDEYDL